MENNISDDSHVYRYPMCKLFHPKPTSLGICHTFNGKELEKILKPTSWRNSFLESFDNYEKQEVLKAKGIDLEEGFVFSLDTMQSYFFNLRGKDKNKNDINSFLIKVHPAGEIPWITKEKNTWRKISSFKNDMSTRFISVSGEMIISEVIK